MTQSTGAQPSVSSACLPSRRREHLVPAGPAQVVGVLLGQRGHVVHHQDQRHPRLLPQDAAGSSTDRPGAGAGLGLDPQRAAEVEHQPADDGEPEPGPAGLGGIEVVEGAIELGAAHARPGVGNDDRTAGPCRRG